MVQYQISFAGEYIKDIVYDLADILKLDVVEEDIDAAVDERDHSSPNNIYILRGKDSCIFVDCNDRDWLLGITVLCREKDADQVKAALLKWDNISRRAYGQVLKEDLTNVYGKKDTELDFMESYYDIKIHPYLPEEGPQGEDNEK